MNPDNQTYGARHSRAALVDLKVAIIGSEWWAVGGGGKSAFCRARSRGRYHDGAISIWIGLYIIGGRGDRGRAAGRWTDRGGRLAAAPPKGAGRLGLSH
jgi:hypothetical protein